MSSRATNNSMQSMFQESAPSAVSSPQLSVAPTASSSSTAVQAVPPSQASISPDLAVLISHAVQAALAAEQANHPQLTPLVSSLGASQSASSPFNGALGGVPAISASRGVPSSMIVPGPSSTGRPLSSIIVPSFVSTFTAPVMSVSSCAVSAASSLFGGALRCRWSLITLSSLGLVSPRFPQNWCRRFWLGSTSI